MRRLAVLLLFFASLPLGADLRDLDLIIVGGRVIDPETRLDAVRNVGIQDGKIVAVSEGSLDQKLRKGGMRIDAGGRVVAPGFIDLHAHGLSDEAIQYRIRDGVTTALELEGGLSQLSAWLASREGKMRLNYGASVSHGEVRALVMPDLQDDVKAAEADLRAAVLADEPLIALDAIELFDKARNANLPPRAAGALRDRLDRGLREGALGFGVAHQYYPGATREEIFQVFRLSAQRKAPIFTHVRSMTIDAMQEVIADAAATGAPLHIVHVNSMSLDKMPEVLGLIDGARRRGMDVTTETYPYTAASTTIDSAIFDTGWKELLGIDYSDLQWQETGERLTEETFKTYHEAGGIVIIHLMKEKNIELAVRTPWVMIASDAMPYDPGAHPRSAGTFARVLGRYVREKETLDLMTALTKMTLLPAQRLETIAPAMKRKGRVQIGADADLVVFEPDTVVDNATFTEGLAYSTGIEHVLVSGTPVVAGGEIVAGAFPGQPVLGRYYEGEGVPAVAEKFARLCDEAPRRMVDLGVPGAAMALSVGGRRFTCTSGVTNIDHPLAVTDETLFQIGSISKTFTGTLLMRLVEAGKVDLNATVRTYLPDFQVEDVEASAKATVRDLLTHVAGWAGDNFGSTGEGDDALQLKVAEMAMLQQIAPIGEVYSYNNASFVVAGRIVEVVTGKTFEDALEEMLLEPIGLDQCFIEAEDVMTHRFAVGHTGGPTGPQVATPWHLYRAANPVGSVVCSVRDLLRYGEFHLGDGTAESGARVLSKGMLARMHAPVLTKHGTDERMALTWHLTDEGGVHRFAHGGATNGQLAYLMLVPEHDMALALLTNAGAGRRFNRDTVKQVLREFLGVTIEDPQPVEGSSGDLQQYAGAYTRPFLDLELRIEDDGRLVARIMQKMGFPERDSPRAPPMEVPIAPFAKDRFVILDGPRKGGRIEFIRKKDGGIGWLRAGGRIHARAP